MTTTFLIHGATLTLACFAAANLLVSALVIGIARLPIDTRSSAFWFGLRVLPAIAALSFTALLFVPSYWRYEPRGTTEALDITISVFAGAGLVMLAAGARRGVSAWWRARNRTHEWMRRSQRIDLRAPGDRRSVPPTFVIEADAPIMALVGLLRPRLLVTRRLIAALTAEELEASVAHELGHSCAWDNVKRLAMRAAPDLLAAASAARAIEQRWVSAAEHAADRMCNTATPARRYALASALVKVARLMPSDSQESLKAQEVLELTTGEPICLLISGPEIASRVLLLLDDRAAPQVSRHPIRSWLCAAIVLAVVAFTYQPLLHSMHELTEVVVQSVP